MKQNTYIFLFEEIANRMKKKKKKKQSSNC